MNLSRCAVSLFLVFAFAIPAFAADTQFMPPIRITDYNSFSVAQVLEQNVGKQVEVTVASGATFKGRLAGVGANAIHLAELSGKEFFDGAIEKSAIVAVVIRARNQ